MEKDNFLANEDCRANVKLIFSTHVCFQRISFPSTSSSYLFLHFSPLLVRRVPCPTLWHVLRLWMEGRLPGMEDNWQDVVLHIGGWAWGCSPST